MKRLRGSYQRHHTWWFKRWLVQAECDKHGKSAKKSGPNIYLQCHCGHINCPCCNLLMNLEITDPTLLQWLSLVTWRTFWKPGTLEITKPTNPTLPQWFWFSEITETWKNRVVSVKVTRNTRIQKDQTKYIGNGQRSNIASSLDLPLLSLSAEGCPGYF